MSDHERATRALRKGQPVLLYDADGREEETDMVVLSEHATPTILRTLRERAGGLICTTLAPEHHQTLGIPYLADLQSGMAAKYPVLAGLIADDIRYDPSRSSFAITLNHRATYTGIPDNDRATTITMLAALLAELPKLRPQEARDRLGAEFRSPGHCILLNGAPGGLATRQGHTELSIELARQADALSSTTICEMLDGARGEALGKASARAVAEARGWVFLTGEDVVRSWQTRAVPTSAS